MTTCSCPVCKRREPNKVGIELAVQEVIPFIKKDLLRLQYPKHPFPLKYEGVLESALAYSQALAFNRAHSISARYYTENKWLLKFSEELSQKFGMKPFHTSEMTEDTMNVCEFNTET